MSTDYGISFDELNALALRAAHLADWHAAQHAKSEGDLKKGMATGRGEAPTRPPVAVSDGCLVNEGRCPYVERCPDGQCEATKADAEFYGHLVAYLEGESRDYERRQYDGT